MLAKPIRVPEDKLAELCQRHGVRRLAVFGSALREDFGQASDIDLLVEFNPGARVGLRFFTIERELSGLFGRKVDLNTPGFLGEYFRDDAVREAETLYEAA